MSTRTITDRGSLQTTITIQRSGSGTTEARVTIVSDDVETIVPLTTAELGATLTGAEVTALKAALVKIYNAALTKAGFA